MAKFRIVLAGCGSMAATWVEYALAREDCRFVALVDIRPEAARAMAAQYKLDCPCFASLDEALDQVDANLLFDLTVPWAHYQTTTTALRRGLDVMSEKPVSDDAAHAREMVRVAAEQGRFYAVLQNRRYGKDLRDLRAFLDSGALGKIEFVCVDFFVGPHFDGFRLEIDHPLLTEMAVHTYDMARFIMGANAVSAYCHEFNPASSWFKAGSSAAAIFEMTGGGVFCYRASWSSEGCPTTWEGSWRVQCEHGTLLWDGLTPPRAQKPVLETPPAFLNQSVDVPVPSVYTGREQHEGCLDAMFDALGRGEPAETRGEDTIHSTMMSLLSIQSAETGRRVEMAEL